MLVGGLFRFNFHGRGLVRQGSDETIPVAELGDGDGDLRLNDRVDAANLVCDLPCALE